MIRTDSPTETAIRFLARRNWLISHSSILVRRYADHPNFRALDGDLIDHPILQVEARGPVTPERSAKGFVVKSLDKPQPRRPPYAHDIFPFLVSLENFFGQAIQL